MDQDILNMLLHLVEELQCMLDHNGIVHRIKIGVGKLELVGVDWILGEQSRC